MSAPREKVVAVLTAFGLIVGSFAIMAVTFVGLDYLDFRRQRAEVQRNFAEASANMDRAFQKFCPLYRDVRAKAASEGEEINAAYFEEKCP